MTKKPSKGLVAHVEKLRRKKEKLRPRKTDLVPNFDISAPGNLEIVSLDGWSLRDLGDSWRSGIQAAVRKLRLFKWRLPMSDWTALELAASHLEVSLLPRDMHEVDEDLRLVSEIGETVKVVKARKRRRK